MKKFLVTLVIFVVAICNCAFAMSIKMFDVGQGDSILIDTGTEKVLIDASQNRERYEYYLSGVSVDKLILSHPHADHIALAATIIKNNGVNAVYDNGQPSASRYYLNYLKAIKARNINRYKLSAGDTLTLDNGAYLECLSPDLFSKSVNDNSLVLKLVYNNFSMLFTGDISAEQETYLADNVNLSANVLKAAHHGSKYSNSLDFIKAVNPDYVLISAGEGYSHPHAAALENFLIAGVAKGNILCTKQNGAVTITTDGQSYSVSSEISAAWIDNYLGYRLTIRQIN